MNKIMKGRYEVRSASGTAWWHTSSLRDARKVLSSHGQPSDYIYDTVTGGRPGRDGKTAQQEGICK